MHVLNSNYSEGVVFQIKKGNVLLDGITLSRHDTRQLIDFLDSLVWSHEVPPKPAEPANLAVLYSAPKGWAFHRVNSKEQATTFAAEVKKESPGCRVRLVNMLADYNLADPVYEWKDI
jgi:hypothetical protein